MSDIPKLSIEARKAISRDLLNKYPDRVPIIVLASDLVLNTYKYIVPCDKTFGSYMYQFRLKNDISAETAIYTFIRKNDTIPMMSTTVRELYDKLHDEDGFMYISIKKENAFGFIEI